MGFTKEEFIEKCASGGSTLEKDKIISKMIGQPFKIYESDLVSEELKRRFKSTKEADGKKEDKCKALAEEIYDKLPQKGEKPTPEPTPPKTTPTDRGVALKLGKMKMDKCVIDLVDAAALEKAETYEQYQKIMGDAKSQCRDMADLEKCQAKFAENDKVQECVENIKLARIRAKENAEKRRKCKESMKDDPDYKEIQSDMKVLRTKLNETLKKCIVKEGA